MTHFLVLNIVGISFMQQNLDQMNELPGEEKREQIDIHGVKVNYTIYKIDARSESQRVANERDQSLDGNLNVYIPGHGQRAATAKSTLARIISHSTSKVVLSFDIDPPLGGDWIKAEALREIIRRKASELFANQIPESEIHQFIRVTIFGWSHGGAIALRAAHVDKELFQHVVCMCPAGLINRSSLELMWSFIVEGLLVFINATFQFNGLIWRALAIGWDIVIGLITDFLRNFSLCRVFDDIRWATRKAVGHDYKFDGTAIVLFGEKDTVIRWRDTFPECNHPGDISKVIDVYKRKNFPLVGKLEIKVLAGNHMAPEIRAYRFINTAFHLINRS